MKRSLMILYWAASVILVSAILVSIGYKYAEALFIGTLFLPGALAVKYFFPKVSFEEKKNGILSAICISMGIIMAEILMFVLAHMAIAVIREGEKWYYESQYLPELLMNPVFISVVIIALAVGNYFFEKWLANKYPSILTPVIFVSDRKTVRLLREEILYIESNDSVTTIFAIRDRTFKNRTPISQWEDYLGDGFIRIHRSYLVNIEHISEHCADSVIIHNT